MATPRDQQVLSYVISGTTTTVSHTVRPGANRLLLVELAGRFASDTSVTYGGTGLTLVSGSQNGAGTAGTAHRRVAMYYLIAPTEGTANLVVVITGNTQGTIRVRNMVDVDQSTPLRSQGSDLALSSSGTSSTSDTLTPATTSGDLVLDLIAVSTTPTIGSGQTLAGFGTQPTNQRSSTKVATGSSESMAWTYSSGTFAHCAVSIVGSTATQPAPEDYTGSRGKKSWHVQAQITTGEAVSAGASAYFPVGPSIESSGAESATGRLAARVPGTWSDPEIYITANATTSASTLTLLEDGTDTGLSITITAGTTGRFAGSGALSVDGTTELSWRMTNGGGGSLTMSMVGLAFEPDGADTVTVLSAHSSSASQLTAGATHHMGVQGSRGFTSTLASAELQLPLGGVWEGLNVVNPDGNTTTGTVDIESFINGAAGNQALAWAASENDTQEDTTNTDTVADGDLINWRAVVGAGTGTFETERWVSRLINEDGEFLLLSAASPAGSGVALSNGVNYFPMAGECGRTSTEAEAQMSVPFDAAIKRLIVRLAENASLLPAVATLRVNGADTALSLEIQPGIAEVVFSQPWDVVDVDAGDLLTINIQQGGASNAARVRYVGVVGIERAAGGGSVSLIVADATHAHAADSLTLTAASALAVADATHSHAADNITLSVAGATNLTVADALHGHAADALALTSAHALIVADATHGHTVDGLTLTAASVLAIQEALHAHAADNVTLDASGAVNLLLADGLHAHTVDGVALTVAAWLTVADALHGHAADNVVLTFGGVAAEPLARYTIAAKARRLTITAVARRLGIRK